MRLRVRRLFAFAACLIPVLSHLAEHAANAVGLCHSEKHARVSGVAAGAGFYTSNNVKTDYNTGNYDIIKASWNESSATAHWRKRSDKAQPFFSVFNLMTSHQSRSMVALRALKKEVQSTLPPGAIRPRQSAGTAVLSGHPTHPPRWRASTIA